MERLKRLSKKDIAKWTAAGSLAAGSLIFGGQSIVQKSEAEDGRVTAQGYSVLYRDEHYSILPNIINEGKAPPPPTPTPTLTPEPTPTPEPLYIHPLPDGNPLPRSTHGEVQDPEIWRKLFSQYDWNVDNFLKIVYCESKANPWATGPGWEAGLLQIHPVHEEDFEKKYGAGSWERRYDPELNVDFGYWLYSNGGYGHWVCAEKEGIY